MAGVNGGKGQMFGPLLPAAASVRDWELAMIEAEWSRLSVEQQLFLKAAANIISSMPDPPQARTPAPAGEGRTI